MSRLHTITTAGLAFGAAAVLLSAAIISMATGSGWWLLVIPSGLAALVVAAVLWAILSRAGRTPGPWQGALAGAAVGLLSHPLMWFLAFALAHLLGWRGSMGEPAAAPPEALAAVPAFTFFSVLLVGWLTVALGAVTGALVAVVQRKRTGPGPQSRAVAG